LDELCEDEHGNPCKLEGCPAGEHEGIGIGVQNGAKTCAENIAAV
jgi:hypothetical protein